MGIFYKQKTHAPRGRFFRGPLLGAGGTPTSFAAVKAKLCEKFDAHAASGAEATMTAAAAAAAAERRRAVKN